MKRQWLVYALAFATMTLPVSHSTAQTKPAGIVSFTKSDDPDWPLEWDIAVPPDVARSNQFEIFSDLQDKTAINTKGIFGFDNDLLSMILAHPDEIQAKPGDPVNIIFRLNPAFVTNAVNAHFEIASGFSRIGSFDRHGTAPVSFSAYGTSGPLKLLGQKIIDLQVSAQRHFIGSRLLLVTIKTSDDHNIHIYEIFLEKTPRPTLPGKT